MLSINLDDVMQVLTNVRGYLIAFGVVALLAIVVMIAVRKLPKAKKKMIRAPSWSMRSPRKASFWLRTTTTSCRWLPAPS